jgi:hypothetical protein
MLPNTGEKVIFLKMFSKKGFHPNKRSVGVVEITAFRVCVVWVLALKDS